MSDNLDPVTPDLETLLLEHRPRLLAMLQRRMDQALAARVDAEDILSQVFLLARHKWDSYRKQSALPAYAWLYRLSRDCLIEAWRHEKRGKRDLGRDMSWPEQSSLQLGMRLIAPDTSPSGQAARKEMEERIGEAMRLLKPAEREVLDLRYFEDRSFGEIGAMLDISEDAASVRCFRALQRLKKLVKT